MPNPIILDENLIREYYLNQKMPLRKVAEKFNVTMPCISTNLKRYSINTRNLSESHKGQHSSAQTEFKSGQRPPNFKKLPVDEIVRLYVLEKKSCVEISKIYNVSHKKILKCLNENGIPRKEKGSFLKGKQASFETKALLSKLKKGKPQPQLQTPESRHKCGLALKKSHKNKVYGWGVVQSKIRKNGGTDAELYFEALLKKAQITNYIRELTIPTGSRGRYSIDFAFPNPKLAIELDGDSHKKLKTHDEERDAFLISSGWKVKRILNKDLFINPGEIIDSIKGMIDT